jgi:hypothetical protein
MQLENIQAFNKEEIANRSMNKSNGQSDEIKRSRK